MSDEIAMNGLRGRCASEAARAVTRWYVDHIYQNGGLSLEEYVKDQILEVPLPKAKP